MARESVSRMIQRYDPAADTDIGTEVTAYTVALRDANGMFLRRIAIQVIFSGYTGVIVHLEATIDGTNWQDIPGATTSTSGDIITLNTSILEGPYDQIRVRATGALSAGTDTIDIYDVREFQS